MPVVKQKCIPCKGQTFSKYKRVQQFFSEYSEQNPSAGFPGITFRTKVSQRQINK